MDSNFGDFVRFVKDWLSGFTHRLECFFDTQPLIKAGEVYSQMQVVKRLGVHATTLKAWEESGLQPAQPGTKAKFYLSDELIDFLRNNKSLKE